jgi:hypothetical protein
MKALYAVSYTEYERGWGQRPDGTSYHRSEEDAKAFTKRIHGDRSGSVPDEYTNADGPPRLVEVSDALYDHVQVGGNYWSTMNSFTQARNWSVLNPKGM